MERIVSAMISLILCAALATSKPDRKLLTKIGVRGSFKKFSIYFSTFFLRVFTGRTVRYPD